MQTLRTGARTPFFATDITYYHSLAGDFSPIENAPAAFTDSAEELYIKNGFVICNATDTAALAYVITWEEFQYHRSRSNKTLVSNATVLGLCTPVAVYLPSGGWCMTPVVKVFDTAGDNASVVTHINVGTIR